MPAADTKTQQLLYALGHRGASTAAANGCCNTKTQDYILDAITRITNEEDARADGDTNLQNQIDNKEGKTITGAGAPTTSTEAANVGQQYYDTTNEKLYYCSAIDTTTDPYTYTWEEVGGDIPTDATFWGASYDATNNSVNETSVLALKNPNVTRTEQLQLKDNLGFLRGGLGENYTGSGEIFIISRMNSHNTRTLWSDQLITFASGGSWQANSYNGLNVTNARIHNVADPGAAQDAATKHYVDTAVGNIETILATLTTGTGTGD